MAYTLLGGLDPSEFDQNSSATGAFAYSDNVNGFSSTADVTKIVCNVDIPSSSSTAWDVGACSISGATYTPRIYVTLDPYTKAGSTGNHTLTFESSEGDFTAFEVTSGWFIMFESDSSSPRVQVSRTTTPSSLGYAYNFSYLDVFPGQIDNSIDTTSSTASRLEIAFYTGSATTDLALDPITTSWTTANSDIKVARKFFFNNINTLWTVADIDINLGTIDLSLDPITTSWSVANIDVDTTSELALDGINTSWTVDTVDIKVAKDLLLDPVTTSWTIDNADITVAKLLSIDPVTTSWTTADAAIKIAKAIALDNIDVSWTIADVDINVDRLLSLDNIDTSWSIADITLEVSGQVVLSLDPIVASWTIADADIKVAKDFALDPITASWTVSDIDPDYVLNFLLDPIITSWTTGDIDIDTTSYLALNAVTASWLTGDADVEISRALQLDNIAVSWTVADIALEIAAGEVDLSLDPITCSWTVGDIVFSPFEFIPAEWGDIVMEQVRYNYQSSLHFEYPVEWYPPDVTGITLTIYDRAGVEIAAANTVRLWPSTTVDVAANRYDNTVALDSGASDLEPGDLIMFRGTGGNEFAYVECYDTDNQIVTLEDNLKNNYAVGETVYGAFGNADIDTRDTDTYLTGLVMQLFYTPTGGDTAHHIMPITKIAQIAVSALDIAGLRRRFKVVYRRAYDALTRPTDTLSHILTEAETQVSTELAGQNLDIQRIVDQNIIAPTIMAKAAWLWALNGDQNMIDEREAYALEYDKQKGYLQNLPIWTDTDQDKVLDEGEVTDHTVYFERGW